MRISDMMRDLDRGQRRALHESVKRRILMLVEGDNTSSDNPSEAPVGSSLTRDGKEIFRKTESGWKTTVRVSLDQILQLVDPDVVKTVEGELEALKQSENFEILKGSLKNPALAGESGKLTFQRDGDFFADPIAIPNDKIDAIKQQLGLELKKGASAAGTGAERRQIDSGYAIGDAIIKVKESSMSITVTDSGDGKFRGFEDIFGRTANIPDMIQRAVKRRKEKLRLKSDKVRTLIFNLSDASEKSVLGFFARKSFPLFGTSQIKFYQSTDEKEFSAEIPLTGAQKESVSGMLSKLADAGRAKKLG